MLRANPARSTRSIGIHMSRMFGVRASLSRTTSTWLGVALFVLLGLGWVAASEFGVNHTFLPSPGDVLSSAYSQYRDQGLLTDIGVSIYRVLVGYAIAAVVAVPLGLLMGSFPAVRAFFEPVISFIRYMPATAFIPLLVLWVGIDDAQKFSVIFVGTFFHLVLLIMSTTLNVPLPFVESAMMLKANRRQILLKVIWPAAKPGIFDNLRVVLGWAWTYIVVAEIVAAKAGVGYVILKSSRFLDTPAVFVGILSIGLVGMFSDYLLNTLHGILFPYIKKSR